MSPTSLWAHISGDYQRRAPYKSNMKTSARFTCCTLPLPFSLSLSLCIVFAGISTMLPESFKCLSLSLCLSLRLSCYLSNVSRTFASIFVYLFDSVRFDFLTIYVSEIIFGAAASCCSFFLLIFLLNYSLSLCWCVCYNYRSCGFRAGC